jgi:hypothetical protein
MDRMAMGVNGLSGLDNPFSGSLTIVRRQTLPQAAPIQPVPPVDALRARPRGYALELPAGRPSSMDHPPDRLELSPAALRNLPRICPMPTRGTSGHPSVHGACLDLFA